MHALIESLLEQMTLEEKVSLTTGKDFWTTVPVERLGIPSIWMSDGPHGVRRTHSGDDMGWGGSKNATCFPTASALSSSWDTELIREVGQALGQECLALDVQVLLGPGINIKRTPLCGRNFEYFSEDPLLTGEMAAAYIDGVQSRGIGTSLKHYACNNQDYQRMSISAQVDERTLREIYLAGFERAVEKAKPWTIMAAYNRVNGVPATENRFLLTEVLQEEWGFKGCTISDWFAVNSRDKALRAGLHLEMPGLGGGSAALITRLVKEGRLAEKEIDGAVRRILGMVLRGEKNRRPGETFDPELHHALARRAAGECMVLLKNERNLLPLEAKEIASLAVIGRFAREPRYQGAGSSRVNPTKLETACEEIKKLLGSGAELLYADGYPGDDGMDDRLIEEAVKTAGKAGAAVVFGGLPARYETEGYDRTHLDLPPAHNRLIEEVCRVQPRTVVVLVNGSAVTMPWVDLPGAILESWLCGQASGGAVADILFGAVNPSGRLSETFPVRLEDTPAYINYPGEANEVKYGEGLFVGYRYYEKKKAKPLFPFGFGLSYTAFEYINLELSREVITGGETLHIRVKVKNCGPREGKEVVQLYLRDEESRLVRPEKELKAFARVGLEPGETGAVDLELSGRDFAYFDSEGKMWVVEPGAFEILVGSSSEDIRLRAGVQVKSRVPAMNYGMMTPIGRFLDDPGARQALLKSPLKDSPLAAVLASEDRKNPYMRMLDDMPVIKLVLFSGGLLTEESLDHIIESVNAANSSET